jgi:hypothetical protein
MGKKRQKKAAPGIGVRYLTTTNWGRDPSAAFSCVQARLALKTDHLEIA